MRGVTMKVLKTGVAPTAMDPLSSYLTTTITNNATEIQEKAPQHRYQTWCVYEDHNINEYLPSGVLSKISIHHNIYDNYKLKPNLTDEQITKLKIPHFKFRAGDLSPASVNTLITLHKAGTAYISVEAHRTDLEVITHKDKWYWKWGSYYIPSFDLTRPIDMDTKWTVEDAHRTRYQRTLPFPTIDLSQPDSIDLIIQICKSMFILAIKHCDLVVAQVERIRNTMTKAKARYNDTQKRLNDIEHDKPFIWCRTVDLWDI